MANLGRDLVGGAYKLLRVFKDGVWKLVKGCCCSTDEDCTWEAVGDINVATGWPPPLPPYTSNPYDAVGAVGTGWSHADIATFSIQNRCVSTTVCVWFSDGTTLTKITLGPGQSTAPWTASGGFGVWDPVFGVWTFPGNPNFPGPGPGGSMNVSWTVHPGAC